MNDAIAIGTMARVDFPLEVMKEKKVEIGVIKASPEMGFLVWLDGTSGEYSRRVNVHISLGEIPITKTFYTVGNFYGLSTGDVSFDEIEKSLSAQFENKTEEECACIFQDAVSEYVAERTDRLITQSIRDACRKLGITKLWKHGGSPQLRSNPNLVIFDLKEKGAIEIEIGNIAKA